MVVTASLLSLLSLLRAVCPDAEAREISIAAMDNYQGASTETFGTDDYVTAGYQELVRELGATIANKPMAPGETLGVSGFNISASTTFSFPKTGTLDGTNPTGWELSAPDESDGPVALVVPWVTVRKGLPLSLEIGANAGWISNSQTGVFGGWGRWGIVEGYRQLPDLSVQVGYAGYVGNDELEMGVMDMSATLGYTLPFGSTKGIHQASFAPYFSIGQNHIHAAPRADLSRTGLEGRVTEVTGFKKGEGFDKSFAPLMVGGGFRILSGEFTFTLAGTYAPNIVPTLSAGMGFTY
ncbi:MAG: hypothetical protein EXR69_11485 [Myxococcales bacterium]|nr:hypothetical protein [Myxococcales bacterium]